MRAAFCRGVGRLVVEDVPRPTPGPGEVVVRVRNCGICGSDLHWYHDQMMIPSVCPGHEIAGEVAEVGAGAAALALGADRVIDDGDPGGLLGDAADAPIDLVIETVGGTADTLDTAAAACRPGGTICVLGAFTSSPPFPALFVLAKELRIVGSLVYGRAGARSDFDIVLDILRRQGRRIAETLITHRFPLADIGRAFATAADKTTGSIKVTIEP